MEPIAHRIELADAMDIEELLALLADLFHHRAELSA